MSELHPSNLPCNLKDLAGKRFGRLMILSRAANVGKFVAWLCRCDCGTEKIIKSCHLRNGHTNSCGCLSREGNRYRHGQSHSPTHNSWLEMLRRCSDPTRNRADAYINRGIRVCDGWKTFENFHADMGDRPAGCTLDRKDNDCNYSCGHCPQCITNEWPANCRWATRKEQCRNRRSSRLITVGDKTATVAEWSELSGVDSKIISYRLKAKWPTQCLLLPPGIIGTAGIKRRSATEGLPASHPT